MELVDFDAYLCDQFSGAGVGATVLVRRAGEILVDRGFGLADRATQQPVAPETIFQIASISKQFAAAAILRLQEQARLSVHDRIERWLPGCPETWERITLHHLLTHTSGIGHWDALSAVGGSEGVTTDELVARIQQAPLRLPPGGGWLYSSLGYVLLARIVERAAGQSYASFLEDHFFVPIGMVSTGVGSRAPFAARWATGYVAGEAAEDFDLDVKGIGTGDIRSTTADMARWDVALTSETALVSPSIAAMTAPQATTTREVAGLSTISYGYGQFVATELKTNRCVIYHTGWNPGFRSVNIWLPDDDIVIILLVNEEHGIDPLTIGLTVLAGLG